MVRMLRHAILTAAGFCGVAEALREGVPGIAAAAAAVPGGAGRSRAEASRPAPPQSHAARPQGLEAFQPGLEVRLHEVGQRVLSGGRADAALHAWSRCLENVELFPRGPAVGKDGDEGWSFFYYAPALDWAYLAGACILACLLDYLVFQRLPINLLWHGVILGCWVVAAGMFNLLVLTRMGEQHAVMWTAGYVLEWMLSMDNLFVFHLIFLAYRTPANQVHKAVFVGIIGAILMRMLFFMVLSELLSFFGWMRWPFGALLIWSGFEAARSNDDDGADVKDTRLIRFLKWVLGDRLRESYDKNGRMFVQDAMTGRVQVTLLFIVVACVELTDIVFALDSVSAKVAQLPDSYVAFSSSVLAMFGLRAMFFIVKDLVDMFSMLKYGLCLILVFIGAELMFSKFIRLAPSTVCITIVAVFVVCIAASYTTRNNQAFADTRSGECGREPDQATRGT